MLLAVFFIFFRTKIYDFFYSEIIHTFVGFFKTTWDEVVNREIFCNGLSGLAIWSS